MGLGCLAITALLFSPRIIIILQWLFGSAGRAYDAPIWPILGFFILPWATVWTTYVLSGGSYDSWWKYLILIIAIMADLGTMFGAGKSGYDYKK